MEEDSSIKEKLLACGQGHILQHSDQLSAAQKADFAKQLGELDFELVSSLYTALYVNPRPPTHPGIQPYTNIMRLDELPAKAISVYRSEGLKLIATGQIALLLLAAQVPTGMSDIGLISHKTLFQVFSERLVRLRELASEATGTQAPPIPFVLVTEAATKGQVTEHFAENNFFGMEPSALCVLSQDALPLVDLEGQILLSEPGKVSVAPSGDGGVLESLSKSRALDWLDEKGVQYVHLSAVDNVLLQVCDPVFLGIVHTDQVEAATKTVETKEFTENARLLALKGGTLGIVECSELNEEQRDLRDLRGRLLYGYENITNHIIKLDLIKRVVHSELRGLYCMTQEKVTHTGEMQPNEPNGLRFRLFYCDLLPFASTSVALVVKREAEFAPAKDSVESARGLLANLHAKWVEKAGGVLLEGNRRGCYCEISALVSYDGEGLEALESQKIAFPFYLYY